jgi:hypothetical protein
MQYYSAEAATWKDSWLQVPNMAPTYEPFITDFETLSCDRNLKSSSLPNSTHAFEYESYGIVFIILIAFGVCIGLLIRNYYYTDNDNNNREKDFSTWIDTQGDHDVTTATATTSDHDSDYLIKSEIATTTTSSTAIKIRNPHQHF